MQTNNQWDGTDKHARELGLQTNMCMMRFVTLYGVYNGHEFIEAQIGDMITRDNDGVHISDKIKGAL